MSFIFGGNTDLTYEQAKRKRELARALTQRMGKAPQSFGEGLSAIGQALAARGMNKRADEAEKKGRGQADSVFTSILGGGQFGRTPPAPNRTPPRPGPNQTIADDTMTALGKDPARGYSTQFDFSSIGPKRPEKPNQPVLDALGVTAEQILGPGSTVQIISGKGEHGSARHRGGHAADVKFLDPEGNVVTLKDPRGKEIALAAARNGITGLGAGEEYMGADTFHMDLYPVDQYTPDMGRAWGSFGDSVESEFVKHSQGDHSGHSHDRQGAPVPQDTRVAQSGPGVEELMVAMSSPEYDWMSPQQKGVLGMLLEQKMQERDPMRQMQLEKGQLELEAARRGPAPGTLKAADGYTYYTSGPKEGQRVLPNVVGDPSKNRPAGITELEWRAHQAGLVQGTPEYQQFILNEGGDPSNFRALHMQALAAGFAEGTPEYQEFMATRGAGQQGYARQTGTNQANLETGGTAAEAVATGSTRGRLIGEAAAQSEINAPKVIEQADEAIKLIDDVMNDPALPQVVGKIQGRMNPEGISGLAMSQEALNVMPKIEQLQGQAFLKAFENLKGGGQITEREGAAATAAMTRLGKRYVDDKTYMEALRDLRRIYSNAKRRAQGEDVPEYVPEWFESDGTTSRPNVIRYDRAGNRIP